MKRFWIIAAAIILLSIHLNAYAVDDAYISNKSRGEATVTILTKSGPDKFNLVSRSSGATSLYRIIREYSACVISVTISSTAEPAQACKYVLPEGSCHLKGQARCAYTSDYECDCEIYTTPLYKKDSDAMEPHI